VYNVDGTRNKIGTISEKVVVTLKVQGKNTRTELLVTGLGRKKVILGYPWLVDLNPDIDWRKGILRWRHDRPGSSRNARLTANIYATLFDKETLVEDVEDQDLVISYIKGEANKGVEEVWAKTRMTKSIQLAQKKERKKPKKPPEELVPKEFHEYLSVFSEEEAGRFPERTAWDHAINLKEGFKPKSAHIYPMSPAEELELKGFLEENLDKNYVRKSKSEQAVPFFFVDKKDGKLRPVQDYRYLNEWTIKDAYPLPLISDLMDKLRGKKYFTKMDVRWGYNNVRIREGDEWKATFKTKFGLFEPTVMFFGLCNLPATFQRMMDGIFAEEIAQGWLVVYMDDILIASDSKEDLREKTRLVLEKLKKSDLFIKPEKCEFEVTKTDYLGFVIEEGQISMDPTKVQGIADWPAPRTVKQLRSFLGFCNFYHKFIWNYSNKCQALNQLLQKNTTWDWTEDRHAAFESLKKDFLKEPVLRMPDPTRPFQIETDASKYASGAILTQEDSNGERHPVAYLSKSFNKAERNYEVYDAELLAVVRALKEWRHHIQGSPHRTLVLSDHRNLTYFRKPQRLNRRQARWALELAEYDIDLKHIPGNKNVAADALSRRPDLCPEEDNDNDDVVLLSEELFIQLIDTELLNSVANAQRGDSTALEALQLITEGNPLDPSTKSNDWTVEKDSTEQEVVFYKGKMFIPDNIDLRRNIVSKHHNALTAGHPGILETINKVKAHYYWPGMRTFIRKYVNACPDCHQFKINRNPTKPALQPIPGSETTRPFAQCSTDFITGLPPTETGEDTIMVVVDHGLTKGVILIPTTEKGLSAQKTSRLFIENMFKRFGIPDKLISDRGVQFDSEFFQEFCKHLGMKSAMSTAYHPQTDGTTERFNQEIELYLSIYCISNPHSWASALPTLEFTHNSRPHADRKQSPFELMYGYAPPAIPQAYENIDLRSTKEKFDELEHWRREALAAHEFARQRMALRIKYSYVKFKKDQLVWLEARNLKLRYNKKISTKREGPFKILEVLGPVNYRLQLPKHWKMRNNFHACLLTLYTENEIYGPAYPRPPADIVEGEPEWEVDRILKHRRGRGGTEYHVLWRGYGIDEASWQTEEDLEHAQEALEDYRRRHKINPESTSSKSKNRNRRARTKD
jgi:hypothetical protein